MDWNLYRYFLAVASEGSLSAAARHLMVSQPTVGRQIAELEEKLDARLFHRGSHGYNLTEAGRSIFEKIQRISDDLETIEHEVSGMDQDLAGRVRITATEGFGSYWLTARLAKLQQLYPQIQFDLLLDVEVLDVGKREADIAIRLTNPQSENMVGRKAGFVGFGCYISEAYEKRYGCPANVGDLSQHRFVDWSHQSAGFVLGRAISGYAGGERSVLRTDTVAAQIEAVRAGFGLMIAPHYLARQAEGTRHILLELDEQVELWVLTHKDLQKTPRVRVVLDFLFSEIRADQPYLQYGLPESV